MRMLDGGADPRYMARRLVRMAVEDIGLADPRALRIALDACEVYERLGSPEGELALAEAVYLASRRRGTRSTTPTRGPRLGQSGQHAPGASASAQRADAAHEGSRLRTGYRYAHDEEGGFAAGERYLPDGVEPQQPFYRPVERGLEIRIAEKLRELRKRNEDADL